MEHPIDHLVATLLKENAYTKEIVSIGIHRYAQHLQDQDFARHLKTKDDHTVHIRTTTLIDDNIRGHLHLDDLNHHHVPHANTQTDTQHFLHTSEPVHLDDATRVLEDDPMIGTYSTDTTGQPTTPHHPGIVTVAYHLPTRPTLAGHHHTASDTTNSNHHAISRTVPVLL